MPGERCTGEVDDETGDGHYRRPVEEEFQDGEVPQVEAVGYLSEFAQRRPLQPFHRARFRIADELGEDDDGGELNQKRSSKREPDLGRMRKVEAEGQV